MWGPRLSVKESPVLRPFFPSRLAGPPAAGRRLAYRLLRPRRRRPGVTRLIDAQLAAAGQGDAGDQAVTLVLDRSASDLVLLHPADEPGDVVAHQIELVHVVRSRRMDGELGGGQPENQPAVADVDVRELEDVAQEGAVGRRVLAVDDGMSANDHGVNLRGQGTNRAADVGERGE